MLVSTMDGYLTAINAATGVEEWSVSTGLTLVSSSISKFEVSCLFTFYLFDILQFLVYLH